MRIICATDDKINLTKDHFGDAKFYNIYNLDATKITFVKSVENTVISKVHPDPSKAKRILDLLDANRSDILVNRAFGTNLSIIIQYITPAIIREDSINKVLEILLKTYTMYEKSILDNNDTYITINNEKEVRIMRLHKNRNKSGKGLQSGGTCSCSSCGYETTHQSGVPCNSLTCPECGATLERDNNTNKTKEHISHSNSRKVAKIDEESCIGCGRCVSSCPFNAIQLQDGKAYIINELCKGCMKCAGACPVNCIS